jgi:hypothetical protein
VAAVIVGKYELIRRLGSGGMFVSSEKFVEAHGGRGASPRLVRQ